MLIQLVDPLHVVASLSAQEPGLVANLRMYRVCLANAIHYGPRSVPHSRDARRGHVLHRFHARHARLVLRVSRRRQRPRGRARCVLSSRIFEHVPLSLTAAVTRQRA